MSAIAAVAFLLGARRADAYVLEHGADGQPVRWTQPVVTFVIDPSIEERVPGGAAAVARAVAAWSGARGAPRVEVASGTGPGRVAVDGQNTVLLAPEGYGPAGDALAVTVLSSDVNTGAIVDADIVVNGIHAFAVLPDDARSSGAAAIAVDGTSSGGESGGAFDLEHVVAHEVGHGLGLADSPEPLAVMYRYSSPGDASRRAPEPDDLDGIAVLYAPLASSGGCAEARFHGATAPAGAWLLATLFAASTLVRRRGSRGERVSP